jgi:hypothetical protein
MDELDKQYLIGLVRDYPIYILLDNLQQAIENQIDELVDVNLGHSGMVKEMSLVAHHLAILSHT